LQNQNPLDTTDTSELMNQMMSYASYDQQAQTNDTLTQLSSTLSDLSSTVSGIASKLDISV
jgi:flagellar basal-body rod modification protein FlgD